MATSGSIDFIVNRDDIITEALEQMGMLAEGQTPSTDQLTSMSRTLNMLVKTWQADGLNLFALQKLYVYLQKDQTEYDIGSGSTDHVSDEYNRTTTTAAAVATDTTVDLTSVSGLAVSDYIGIKLDNGTMQWTTVSSIATLTVTLNDALTGAVSSGVTVFYYTSKSNRPMKIKNAVVTNSPDGNDTPIWVISRQEYVDLPNKSTSGQVNQIYYDPQVGAGILSVWPVTDTVDKYLTLWVQRTLEDFDGATDDADYPQEWYLPLALNLAALSCTKYGVPRVERDYINRMALGYKSLADSFDIEDGFQLQPEYNP